MFHVTDLPYFYVFNNKLNKAIRSLRILDKSKDIDAEFVNSKQYENKNEFKNNWSAIRLALVIIAMHAYVGANIKDRN